MALSKIEKEVPSRLPKSRIDSGPDPLCDAIPSGKVPSGASNGWLPSSSSLARLSVGQRFPPVASGLSGGRCGLLYDDVLNDDERALREQGDLFCVAACREPVSEALQQESGSRESCSL